MVELMMELKMPEVKLMVEMACHIIFIYRLRSYLEKGKKKDIFVVM